VRAHASHKSFVPLEPSQSPEQSRDGNPDVRWEGKKRSNATHRSTTDPDARLACKGRERIEELWGEGQESHGLRRFSRRGLERARQEAHLIGWLLNLKRLATLSAPA
jgi:hypothetical protein